MKEMEEQALCRYLREAVSKHKKHTERERELTAGLFKEQQGNQCPRDI